MKNRLHEDFDFKPAVPAEIRCKEARKDIYQSFFVEKKSAEYIAKELNLPLDVVKVAINKMRS